LLLKTTLGYKNSSEPATPGLLISLSLIALGTLFILSPSNDNQLLPPAKPKSGSLSILSQPLNGCEAYIL
jgi:hypothetical protein